MNSWISCTFFISLVQEDKFISEILIIKIKNLWKFVSMKKLF